MFPSASEQQLVLSSLGGDLHALLSNWFAVKNHLFVGLWVSLVPVCGCLSYVATLCVQVPEDMQDKEFAAILQDEPMQPLALVPLTEEEQVSPSTHLKTL